MIVAERPPVRRKVYCDGCHRSRFYVYQKPNGKLILVCYNCGEPADPLDEDEQK